MRRIGAWIVAAAVAAGCAAHPAPIVDMQGVDPVRFERDLADCQAYADRVRIEAGAARGAVAGVAVGAAAGAISGDAASGAGYGTVVGVTRSGLGADRERRQVARRCLRGRGYRVLN